MQKQSFNRDWRFLLGEPSRWTEVDDSTWSMVNLPHDWSIGLERSAEQPSGVAGGFFPNGSGCYRKTFDAPEDWRGKPVMVEFEGVYMNAEVWLNENYLGRHPYGYTEFTYDLTPYLRIGEQNTLKVTVDNSQQLNSRWYSGSGIYRPVWLYVSEPVHIMHWGISITTPEVSRASASLHVLTRVINEGLETAEVSLQTRVLDPSGGLVAQAERKEMVRPQNVYDFHQVMIVFSPKHWSPDSPSLYQLETQVVLNGELVDTETTPFGIRLITVDAENGFMLNGQPLKLKGGCVHHDNGILGSASYARSEERKVEIHKASGYNAIRTAHNPPSPSFLDACDRLGMLVLDEAFDCWREGKNPGDYHLSFDDWWQRDITAMVLRDRNHPSVVFWSIGNEVMERDGRSAGAQIAKMLADEVRKLDPTRPVTSAICGIWDNTHRYTWESTDPVFGCLDVGGYNYQWRQSEPDHTRHPMRVMMGTESFPIEAFDNWMGVMDHSYVIGDFVWTSLDYLGESGIGRVVIDESRKNFLGDFPWHQANCGDLDLTGFKRPQSYYRDIVWKSGEPLYLAVHTPFPEGQTATITQWGWPAVTASWTWPGSEGKSFTVDVYSACDQVELFLNQKSLGTKSTGKAERYTATYNVPYEAGELKVVGINGENPAAEFILRTAGMPEKILLTVDRATIRSGEGDLCYVTVDVVDSEGCRNPNADQLLQFNIQGAGAILAVGTPDPVSTELYVGSQHKVYQGRCLVVVKPGYEAGEITLSAQGEGLQGAEVVIGVK